MKKGKLKVLLLILTVTLSACSNGRESQSSACFYEQFSTEHGAVLKRAVDAFNGFLETNYPNQAGTSNKTIAYLKDLETYSLFNPNWKFSTEANKSILEAYESSGLRKSIYIRGDETEGWEDFVATFGVEYGRAGMDRPNLEENGQALYFNEAGKLKDAVSTCSDYWAILESYYEERKTALNMSSRVIIQGLEREIEPSDYENPIIQSIIFIELFSWQMNDDLKREGS